MNQDSFNGFADSPMAPAQTCFAITPADSTLLPHVTKGIYIGTGGTVVLVPMRGGAPVTFVNVASGSILDVRATAVHATGTTAADMIGLA